jgi:hypothetical protein
MRRILQLLLLVSLSVVLPGCWLFEDCEDKNDDGKCDGEQTQITPGPRQFFVSYTHHCTKQNSNEPAGRQCQLQVTSTSCDAARDEYDRSVARTDPCYQCNNGERYPGARTFRREAWQLEGRCNQ